LQPPDATGLVSAVLLTIRLTTFGQIRLLLTTAKARRITRKEPVTIEIKDIDFQINSVQLEP
jgi:hypothetical protein